MITNADEGAVLRRYGAGKIDVAETAELLRAAHGEAQAAYEARQARMIGAYPHADEDDVAVPRGWSAVGVALATRVINRKQYEALMAELNT